MKKNTILKVLSFVILLTFVLSAVLLSGCHGQIKEDIAKAQEDLGAAQTAIQTANSKIEQLQSDLNALRDASATKADLNTQIEALQNQINQTKSAITSLQTALAEQKTELEGKIAAEETARIKGDKELSDSIGALSRDVTALTTTVNTMSGQIRTLQEQVADILAADSFADYVTATEILATEYFAELSEEIRTAMPVDGLVFVYHGEIVEFKWNEDSDEDVPNPLSYWAFEDLSQSLAEEDYYADDYAEYVDYCNYLYFKLARAVSAQDIRDIFDALIAKQNSIPTLAESFEAELLRLEGRETAEDEINGVLDFDEDQLDKLDELYELVPEVTDEQNNRYWAIKEAKADLLNAEAEAKEIAHDATEEYVAWDMLQEQEINLPAIFKYEDEELVSIDVLYIPEVEARIVMVNGQYDELTDEYFNEEDELVALYGVTADDLTGYSMAKAQATLYAYLQDAKEALDTIVLTTIPGISACPLYSDLAPIDADIALINAWAAQWEIEDEEDVPNNYQLIVDASMATKAQTNAAYEGVTYAFIKAVRLYAFTMDGIYQAHVVGYVKVGDQTGNLAEQLAIEIETGAQNVRYVRAIKNTEDQKYELDTMIKAIDALIDAVTEVDGFNADIDNNVRAMLGLLDNDTMEEALAIAARVYYLRNVKASIDEVNAELVAKLEDGITFADGENIMTGWAERIETIFDVDDLRYWDEEDEEKTPIEGVYYTNYLDMTEDFRNNLAELQTRYDDLKKEVQKIYDEVKEIVKADDDAVKTLTNLQKILWANKKVSALEGVTTPSFVLNDADEPNGTITFQEFRGMLTARVLQLVALAENADAETVDTQNFNNVPLNNAIATLTDYNLNKTEAYKDVLIAVVGWIDQYLNIDVTEVNEEGEYVYLGEHAPEIPDFSAAPEEPEEPGEEPNIDDYEDEDAYNAAYEAWQTACEEYDVAYGEYINASEEFFNTVVAPYYEALFGYLRNYMDEYILDLFDLVKDVFQATATVDADGNLNGADGYILGIGNFNYPLEGNYEFIENFQAVIDAAEEMFEMYAAAHAEWEGILEDVDALPAIADIRIHDDQIIAAYERYNDYVEDFYAGAIIDDQFGEPEVYDAAETVEDLLGKYTELQTKKEAAEGLYAQIIALATDLKTNYALVPAEDQVVEILGKVDELRAKIELYRENYCDAADTDQCKFVAENIDAELIGYQAQARAQIVQVIADEVYFSVIEYLGKTYQIGTNPQDGTTLKSIFCLEINEKTSILAVKASYELFIGLTVDPALVAPGEAPEPPEGDEPDAPDPVDEPVEPDIEDYYDPEIEDYDWEAYGDACDDYDTLYFEYDTYLIAYEEYEEALADYQAAQAAYEEALAEYEASVELFNADQDHIGYLLSLYPID